MKNQMPSLGMLAGMSAALWLCTGCNEQRADAEESAPAILAAADLPQPDAQPTPETPELPAPTNAPDSKVVKPAALPENIKMSDALKEVVKLAQAGVPEDVILAYVTNSAQPFYLGSDALVYLNDLGVSPGVQTALIYHDNLPSIAEKKSIGQPPSLPPNLVLNTPARTAVPPLRQTTPPAPAYAGETPAEDLQPPEQAVTVPQFYDSLAPYGNWVQVEDVGLCWQPTVAVVNSGWRPYGDRGRWLWSDSGWYWYSDYSWGWAPFHYGRWCSYPRLGWVWAPDTVWGPSWVSWRYTHDYCGWAPLPPRCYAVRGRGLWFGGSAVSVGFDFGLAPHCYTFVPSHRFCDPSPHRYFVGGTHATTIYSSSTVINNYVVGNNNTIINHGIGHDRVAQMTRSEIPRVRLVDAPVPTGRGVRAERIQGSGASMVVTRPRIAAETPIASVPPRHEVSRNQGLTSFSATPKPSIGEPSSLRTSPIRPQVTANSVAARSESPTHLANSITAPGRPSAFTPASGIQTPSPALNSGNSSQGTVQRSSPPATVATRNEAPGVNPARQRAPQGSINRENASSRPDSAPSIARPQPPSRIAQPDANPRIASPAPFRAEPVRPSTFSPAVSAPAPMRVQPVSPPSYRAEPARISPAPPTYRAEPARPSPAPPAISGPPASVPSPAHVQSGGGNRSESRPSSGGGNRGRNER